MNLYVHITHYQQLAISSLFHIYRPLNYFEAALDHIISLIFHSRLLDFSNTF